VSPPQLVTFLLSGTRLTLDRGDEYNRPGDLLGTVAYRGAADIDLAMSLLSSELYRTGSGLRSFAR
jgi:hypothetical protein